VILPTVFQEPNAKKVQACSCGCPKTRHAARNLPGGGKAYGRCRDTRCACQGYQRAEAA